MSTPLGPDDRLKVFVSYSRSDANWTDQLIEFLQDSGFRPLVDRQDIASSEIWEARLGNLLLEADSVVFVLTEAAAASERCRWEVEKAQALGKRIFPVLPHQLAGDVSIPPGLAQRNYVLFYEDERRPGAGFYDGQKRLAAALAVDHKWLRVQTEMLEQATRWDERGWDEYLLRGEALAEALEWRKRTPAGVTPPAVIDTYLAASSERQDADRESTQAEVAEKKALKHGLWRLRRALKRERERRGAPPRAETAVVEAPRPPPPRPQRPPPAPPPRMERPPPPARLYTPPPRRTAKPWRAPIGLIIVAMVIAGLVGAALHPSARQRLQDARAQFDALLAQVAPPEAPRGPGAVPAEPYAPLREAFAGAAGANVRDYPLPSEDLLAELPAGAPLNITARLQVQGAWWFRVRLEDGRLGFVHQDGVRWGRAVSDPSRFAAEPIALEAAAGPDGANVRAGPGLEARALFRLQRGTPVRLTGKVRQGEHWWLRLEASGGRMGFARADVLRTRDGAALSLDD